MTGFRLILNVCRRNRDTTLALFRSVINRIKRTYFVSFNALRQYRRDRGRQRRLTVVNVTNRTTFTWGLLRWKVSFAMCFVSYIVDLYVYWVSRIMDQGPI